MTEIKTFDPQAARPSDFEAYLAFVNRIDVDDLAGGAGECLRVLEGCLIASVFSEDVFGNPLPTRAG
jgi:hypothetical protein